LALVLVLLVFLVRTRPRPINDVLMLVAGQIAYFAATISQYVYLVETRLLLPVFPLLSVVGAYALAHVPVWDRKKLRISRVLTGVIVVVFVVNLMTQAHSFFLSRPLPPLLGLESREDYLIRRLGAHYQAMYYLNQHLPADSSVFFLWEPRSYHTQLPSQPDPTLDNLAQLRLTYGDAESALAALRSRGFTHLLYYRAGLEFLEGPTPRPPTLTSLLNPVPIEESHYPLSNEGLDFLRDLLGQCRLVESLGTVYEIYQIL
jgi:hypothetical protein